VIAYDGHATAFGILARVEQGEVGAEHVRSENACFKGLPNCYTHLNLPTNDEPPLLRSVGSIDIK
jgi:hypothetical protein